MRYGITYLVNTRDRLLYSHNTGFGSLSDEECQFYTLRLSGFPRGITLLGSVVSRQNETIRFSVEIGETSSYK